LLKVDSAAERAELVKQLDVYISEFAVETGPVQTNVKNDRAATGAVSRREELRERISALIDNKGFVAPMLARKSLG
jgi:hypothetical protein